MSLARPLVEALASGGAVFGVFAGEGGPDGEGGRSGVAGEVAVGRGGSGVPDFAFYDRETATWDMDALRAWCSGGSDGAPATLLRIPPVGDAADDARRRVAEGIAAGADGLIVPQVESPDEVAVAVAALRAAGRRLWPADADADTLLVAQIESRSAVAAAGEILGADGVAVGLPGQKDLRASYAGDERAVQEAVEEVRRVCDSLGVPCGVTAGSGDVVRRLEQGFRFIIATAPEAVAVGRARQGAWKS